MDIHLHLVARMCLPMSETALEEIQLARNIVNFLNKWRRAHLLKAALNTTVAFLATTTLKCFCSVWNNSFY